MCAGQPVAWPMATNPMFAESLSMFRTLTAPRSRTDYRRFVLSSLQPGLAGFMDGTMSTLAPVFAAAFSTGNSWDTFRVGLAAAIGAGISMGVTEIAADDGKVSGRGSPGRRGLITGLATLLGGLGHALPYLISDFATATAVALCMVLLELAAIVLVQQRFLGMPLRTGLCQVVLGGALVAGVGLMIGQT